MIKQLVGLIAFALILMFAKNAYAVSDIPTSKINQQEVGAKKIDRRAKILSEYLRKFDSPLQNYAQDFVDAADKYEIDWKLVIAISGVESTFGKFIPGGYNGWGWGVYGTQTIYFASWKDAINTVSQGLKEKYIDKGLRDPYAMNAIYAESKTWGSKVDHFLKDIQLFADKYDTENPSKLEVKTDSQIAAVSGQIASQ